MKVCKKHKAAPAIIYGECIGCEIDGLRADVKAAKHCITSLKAERDQARLAAAMECVKLLKKMGKQRMSWTFGTHDHVSARYAVAVIRQHFGITDHIANVGKMVEGGEP